MRKQNNTNHKKIMPKGQIETVRFSRDMSITTDNRQTDPAWTRLTQAIAEIVTSDCAPESLKRPVTDFLYSESGKLWSKLILTPPVIQHILLDAVTEEDQSDEKE